MEVEAAVPAFLETLSFLIHFQLRLTPSGQGVFSDGFAQLAGRDVSGAGHSGGCAAETGVAGRRGDAGAAGVADGDV